MRRNHNKFTILILFILLSFLFNFYAISSSLRLHDTNFEENGEAFYPLKTSDNSNPEITSIIQLTPEIVFRTEECEISVNVSDLETVPENLTVTLYLQDSEGEDVLEELLEHVSGNEFSGAFTVPWNRPIGKYRVNITATDENNNSTSKITSLTVKNNPPEIFSYEINGNSMDQSISIPYGRNIVFSFNVSDIEGVALIKVALIDENDEWYNITASYNGIDTEIVIRTAELITGTWFVYLFVIDSDGETVGLIDDYNFEPQGIRIIPEVISDYIPWIFLFLGFVIGVIIGVGSVYSYFKLKYRSTSRTTLKKKKIPLEKSVSKEKVKSKPIKEELEKKDTIEKIGKEEEKTLPPKRKIKRKI